MSERSSESLQRSLIWGALLTGGTRFGQVLVSLLLIRLLTPEVYGQFGFLGAVIAVAYVFSMQRFMEFTFHQPDSDVDQDAQLSFGVLLHVGLFAAVLLVAFGISFNDLYAAVSLPLAFSAIGLLINVPRIFHSVLLQREMKWRRIRILHLVSFAMSSSVAIALALLEQGIWALVAHSVLVPIPFALDAIQRLSGSRFTKVKKSYLPTFYFGIKRNLTDGFQALRGLLESSVLVLLVGFSSFGLYGRAIGISQLLIGPLIRPLNTMLYPFLTQVDSIERVRVIVGLLVRVTAWIALPMCLLLSLHPDAIIRIAFGPNWRDVVELVPAVSVLFFLQVYRESLVNALTSQLGAELPLRIEALVLFLSALALLAALDGDLLTYVHVLIGVNVGTTALTLVLVIRHGLIDSHDHRLFFLGITAGFLMSLAAISFLTWMIPDMSGFRGLAVSALAVSVSFLAAVRLFDRAALVRLISYLPGDRMFRKVLLL